MNEENTTKSSLANLSSSSSPFEPSRRQGLQWVMAAVAASALPSTALAQIPGTPEPKVARQEAAGQQPNPGSKGYGVDVDLLKAREPGEFWPLTFTDAQRKTATSLADVILPKDQYGPAASELGVVAMVDEWISAPYPDQRADRPIVIEGLAWLETESTKRFSKSFPDLADDQKRAICDDICHGRASQQQFRRAATFFSKFRSLSAAAYYATPAGWKAIGYVGNVAMGKFDGPPPEVLRKLGVMQTVE